MQLMKLDIQRFASKASIFSLFGEIFIDNEKANKSLDETTGKGKLTAKSFAEGFANVTKTALKVGTAVAGAATTIVGTMTAAANKTAESTDVIDKASIRMGISKKSYQELSYAAGQCGVEMSALEKATKKLEGTDLNMEDAMQQIMSLSTAEERASKAAELFGDNIAYTLSPLIEQSTEDYDGLIQRANDLELVMGDDAVKAGVEFGDLMSDVKQSMGALGNSLTSSFIPILNNLLKLIIDKMPQIQSMINTLAPILVNLLETILPVLVQFVEEIFPLLMDLIIQLLPPIAEIIKQILPIFVQILQMILPPLIEIIKLLLPPLMEILEALMPLLTPILDMLIVIINTALMPIIKVNTSIINLIAKGLVGTLNGLKPVLEGVKKVFENVFGAIWNIVKAPINFLIDGMNSFISSLNKIKIPDWVPLVGGKGINLPLIQRLKVGMDYVPYDEMPALLHKGEAVLTAEENKEYKQNKYKEQETNKTINYYNTINIDKVEVREEKDITRIAEELYYLQQKGEV